MNNRYLFSIILVVFIDLLGFSLIIPLLPYYAQTFNASDTTIGLLLASYAAAQLIGAPLLGHASDRFGRRPILLISIFGTFLGFLIFGFAKSLTMLFASRILQGLTGGNLSVAQAYITDVTDAKSRNRGLGMIVIPGSFLVLASMLIFAWTLWQAATRPCGSLRKKGIWLWSRSSVQ